MAQIKGKVTVVFGMCYVTVLSTNYIVHIFPVTRIHLKSRNAQFWCYDKYWRIKIIQMFCNDVELNRLLEIAGNTTIYHSLKYLKR